MANEILVTEPLPPGSTIGMVGGGQLGRMTAVAAAAMGYRVHVYAHTQDSPTAEVCAANTVADWENRDALERFARAVDVVTYEWENIPLETLHYLEQFCPVHPSPSILAVAQDRLVEKRFVEENDIPTTPYEEVETRAELEAALGRIGTPCVVKSARFGYDGKGQAVVKKMSDAGRAWEEIGERRAIVERFVDHVCEMSVIVARSASGALAIYDPVVNHHVHHILATTEAPAPVDAEICQRAVTIARTLAEALGLVGVLAVELFLTQDDELFVNEIAPRPHNSGHWTIDAAHTSQFEQLVRAVCHLPLGSPRRHSDAVSENLIGPIGERWLDALQDPLAKLHIYGKHEARPGRKMGHVTRLSPLSAVDHSLM